MPNTEQDGLTNITRVEHNVDAISKKVTLRQFDPVSGNWVNLSAVDNGDGTYSLKPPTTIENKLQSIIDNTDSLESSYALRYDEGATYTYIGEAVPGTATSAASWRIKRLTNADNTIVWAGGDSNFNNVWDDRASEAYS